MCGACSLNLRTHEPPAARQVIDDDKVVVVGGVTCGPLGDVGRGPGENFLPGGVYTPLQEHATTGEREDFIFTEVREAVATGVFLQPSFRPEDDAGHDDVHCVWRVERRNRHLHRAKRGAVGNRSSGVEPSSCGELPLWNKETVWQRGPRL